MAFNVDESAMGAIAMGAIAMGAIAMVTVCLARDLEDMQT